MHKSEKKEYAMKVNSVDQALLDSKQEQLQKSEKRAHYMISNNRFAVKMKEEFVAKIQGINRHCMIFELSQKGDLEQMIDKRRQSNLPFKEEEIIRILINIILALDEIHDIEI